MKELLTIGIPVDTADEALLYADSRK